jgi:hypothetical protein
VDPDPAESGPFPDMDILKVRSLPRQKSSRYVKKVLIRITLILLHIVYNNDLFRRFLLFYPVRKSAEFAKMLQPILPISAARYL